MTQKERLIAENKEDPEFIGALITSEDALIRDQVICGFIPKCPPPFERSCLKCQKDWLKSLC